jgi:hypothetical protein
VGCPACRGTGYRGRTGIFELRVVDDELRDAVTRRAGAGQLRRLALERGMRPLRADGWRQVVSGVTTVEEVRRVVPAGLGGALAPRRGSSRRKGRSRTPGDAPPTRSAAPPPDAANAPAGSPGGE